MPDRSGFDDDFDSDDEPYDSGFGELSALDFAPGDPTGADAIPEQPGYAGDDYGHTEYGDGTYDGGGYDDGVSLDQLDFAPAEPTHQAAGDGLSELFGMADDDDETPGIPLFTLSNPQDSVTVTTYMDGRVHQIELSPAVTSMTESELAGEVRVIARLAAIKGKAGQYTFLCEQMDEQGHSSAASRDFLNRDLNLPTPEQAAEEQAAVFAQRYAGDHD